MIYSLVIQDSCLLHFSRSYNTTWVMGDPTVIEQMNTRGKDTFFITETNYQAPLTCPSCLLGVLAPRVSVSQKAGEQSSCHQ